MRVKNSIGTPPSRSWCACQLRRLVCRAAEPTRLRHHCKRSAVVLILGLLALVACQPEAPSEAGLDAFAEAFREANQAPGIEPMLALYALEGTTDQTSAMLKNALLYEHGLPIRSIDFEPLSGAPEESIRYEHQGVRYGPTLEPLQRMRVRYTTEDRFESLFTLGQNDEGAWRIVSSRPIE